MNPKRILKCSIFIVYSVALICFFLWLGLKPPAKTIPEKIIDTTVFVNTSSGTVIYSDRNTALILTAYHVIAENSGVAQCSGCGNDIVVAYLHTIYYPGMKAPIYQPEGFVVESFDVDSEHDLAILRVNFGHKVPFATIARFDPSLGDDIWTSSNPNHLYRSIKKGVIGSKERFTHSPPYHLWEVSSGVINGSSGGGAFDIGGRLFGVIDSVEIFETDNCFGLLNVKTGQTMEQCVEIPMTFLGFVIPPETVRGFLVNGAFGSYFDYLR